MRIAASPWRLIGGSCARGGGAAGLAEGDLGGQGTVEYALVLFAFAAVVGGIAALAGLFGDGAVASHALASASHGLGSAGGVADALLY